MKNKRWVLSAGALAVVGMMLTGCSASGDAQQTSGPVTISY
ncbi:hypothetical protein [Rathayibacter soli]|nr:hypothetical protein [Glaciibacter superstes]